MHRVMSFLQSYSADTE
uniref:Uncharacterized protein n=1 Tax=Anguilla anguilla TaxID=7936 RepID=A0A0E9V056_ANGAN